MKALPTCAQFRVIRDQLAYEAMTTRLPALEAQIEALWTELAPIWKAMRDAKNKHERELAYGRMEDGMDMRYQQLTFERDAIVSRLEAKVAQS